jgi:hypothetical protein
MRYRIPPPIVPQLGSVPNVLARTMASSALSLRIPIPS